MGFEKAEYKFKEGESFPPDGVYIAIEKKNSVTISSNFAVTVHIQTTSTADAGSTIASFLRL